MTPSKYRFGFIGCGSIAQYHADVIKSLGHCIQSVAARPKSNNIDTFKKKYNVKNTYDNYQIMLRCENLDALIVCVSWKSTEKIIGDICSYKIPSLIEKPVALSSAKLSKVIDTVGPCEDFILVGYNRRFYDYIDKLKNELKSQQLLSINMVVPENRKGIVKRFGLEINDYILHYMSSHWLDIVFYLTGPMNVLFRKKNTNSAAVNGYHGLLESINSNCLIHYSSDFDTCQNVLIKIVTTEKCYELCPVERLRVYEGIDIIEPTPSIPIRQYVPHLLLDSTVDTLYKPGFHKQIEYFIQYCIQKQHTNKVGATLLDSLHILSICDKLSENKNY